MDRSGPEIALMSRPTPLTYDILLALTDADRHGYGIIKEIEEAGGSPPSTGALYLALQRMESTGLIEEAQRPTDDEDARRRYYRMTSRGRETAEQESIRLAQLVARARSKDLFDPASAVGDR
jgi:DNA-binding PadR family transcriptional regulator